MIEARPSDGRAVIPAVRSVQAANPGLIPPLNHSVRLSWHRNRLGYGRRHGVVGGVHWRLDGLGHGRRHGDVGGVHWRRDIVGVRWKHHGHAVSPLECNLTSASYGKASLRAIEYHTNG